MKVYESGDLSFFPIPDELPDELLAPDRIRNATTGAKNSF